MVDQDRARSVYIVNAATLNLAYENPLYRAVLNRGDLVLNDGTGVRWAARAQGVWFVDNNVGTDLVPLLCAHAAPRLLRLYLIGGVPETVEKAGKCLMDRFPTTAVVGMQQGYFLPSEEDVICANIVACDPDVVLVGMGNPLQEWWIDRHLAHLKRGVVIGVGGLFDHLADNLRRAPLWMRQAGFEWVQILWQQPYKWRRYLLGNPLFLYRMRYGQPREGR
jgi:N-acetylglucosaminyldiphosphoundecaprenol N-acetyl-beta-D-mannosaminyltransferase